MVTPSSMDVCGRVVSFIVCACFQAIVGRAFSLLQKMNFRDPRKLRAEMKTRHSCVIRSSIVLRRKPVAVMPASLDDFLLWSQPELPPLDILLKTDVSLYCITPDFAVFVRTSPDTNCYRSETSPFFYMAQFVHAKEVYITSHHWFHVLTSEIAEESRAPVTWLSNTGRCGSTMICQIMEGVPGTVCVSEPDALINVVYMVTHNLGTSDQRLSLLRSAILILVYHARTQQSFSSPQGRATHIFIKPRSECTALLRDIHTVCPQIRHVFMHRRLPETLQSFKQLIERLSSVWVMMVDSDRIAAWSPDMRMSFFHMLFTGPSEDREAVMDLVPSLSVLGIMAAKVGSSLKMVQRLQSEGFPIPALLYEDVLADPVTTVGGLFDHLQLSRDHLEAALSSMSTVSQRRVPGFVKSKQSPGRPMTDRERREVDNVLARLQLLKVDDQVAFSQRIGHDSPQLGTTTEKGDK